MQRDSERREDRAFVRILCSMDWPRDGRRSIVRPLRSLERLPNLRTLIVIRSLALTFLLVLIATERPATVPVATAPIAVERTLSEDGLLEDGLRRHRPDCLDQGTCFGSDLGVAAVDCRQWRRTGVLRGRWRDDADRWTKQCQANNFRVLLPAAWSAAPCRWGAAA